MNAKGITISTAQIAMSSHTSQPLMRIKCIPSAARSMSTQPSGRNIAWETAFAEEVSTALSVMTPSPARNAVSIISALSA